MTTSSSSERLLNCDAIYTRPITIDWRETLGDDCEGWRSYECSTCPECGKSVVVSCLGECECRDALPEVDVCHSCESNPHSEGCAYIEYLDTRANVCTATLYNEGPLMNYWYPLKLDNCEEAAKKIAHLPLCVVEFKDGTTGLALTGGGMDLSWEIVEAFIELGYWPPIHFCDLPRMGSRGKSQEDRSIIEACMESCRVVEGWNARTRERLQDLVDEHTPLPSKALQPI